MAYPPARDERRKEAAAHNLIPLSESTKTEVLIHVYDLLPRTRTSSLIWHLGLPLVHTSLYIPALGKEYSFAGHSRPETTGVYTSLPGVPPPGARLKRTLRLGEAPYTPTEVQSFLLELAQDFPGSRYHILKRNCNHFTERAVRELLGTGLPSWCNRAAALGRAMPCLVPPEWAEGPETRVVVDNEDDERATMLRAITMMEEQTSSEETE